MSNEFWEKNRKIIQLYIWHRWKLGTIKESEMV